MKRFSPVLLLLLNGCFSCGKVSHVQPVDPELKVYQPAVPPLSDLHPSKRLDRIAPGTWARYFQASDGSETTITFGAVRAEEKALWVEVVEEGDPKKASLRRIAFDGEVTSARFREIPASGPPSEIADQPVSSGLDTWTSRGTPSRVSSEKKTLRVGDRTVEATVYRKVYRDEAVGREFEEEEAWSTEVPPILEDLEISGAAAGLVYRKSRSGTVNLADWGTGYSPVIP